MFNALMRLKSKLGATRILLGAWAAFSGLNAQAADLQSVDHAFGNTVLAIYPDGRAQRLWLHEDGGYDAVGRHNNPSSGKWSLKGGQVCLKQSRPFWSPLSYCTAFPPGGDVGVTWAGKDLSGAPIRLKLVKGILKTGTGGAAAN